MRYKIMPALSLFLVACGGAPDTQATEADKTGVEASTAVSAELPELAGDHVWVTDYGRSSVKFSFTSEGNDFEGSFQAFESVVRLNPDDLSGAEIHARIDMTSFDTNSSDANSYLATREWFNSRNIPVATFTSTAIRSNGAGEYEASGDLTIKDTTLPVTLPFSLDIDSDQAHAIGTLTINRLDYGVGEGDYEHEQTAAYEVPVLIEIYATR